MNHSRMRMRVRVNVHKGRTTMRYLLGVTKACSRILLCGSVVWAVASCGAEPQPTAVAQQAALGAAGGPGGGDPGMHPDEIVGPFTQDLNGVSLTYRYSHDGDYYITYGSDTVTFRLPLPDGTHTPPITVPYYARKLRGNMYMVHWVNPERTVHVTQVVDLPHREVNVAALMPGQWQLFDVGHISEMTKPKKHKDN